MIGFCAKFYPDLHHVLHPFRSLSKASEAFAWTTEHDVAFEEVKKLVANKVSLTLFDPNKPVEIWCDASPHGLGAILVQDQGPVCCASRTLVGPEKNYPQIDIELLAVIWALERFNLFTYGRHVLVRSDHSPLTRIVKKPLADLSIRQQRLVARSLRYDFEIMYHPGKFMTGPDAFSRAPLPAVDEEYRFPLTPDIDVRDAYISVLRELPISDRLLQLVRMSAVNDEEYRAAVQAYQGGWPSAAQKNMSSYWSSRSDMHVDDGLLYFDQKLVIPVQARQEFLAALHRGHTGVSAMIRRAKFVWWPGITKDCKAFVVRCSTCQLNAPRQCREPMMSHEIPTAPGVAVSSDYAEYLGKSYVIVADQFSGWAEHLPIADKTPRELIRCFLTFMARNGIPRVLLCDAQGSFMSQEFQDFCAKWSIHCVHCTPEHHQSNGLAESAVKRFKKWLRCSKSDGELTLAMLQWAQTPIAAGRPSPAQIHFGRNLRDDLHARVEPSKVEWQEIKQWKQAQREEAARVYDRQAKSLRPLAVGDEVFALCRENWRFGQIIRVMDQPRAYVIKLHDTGRVVERNRRFIRPNLTGLKRHSTTLFHQSLLLPEPRVTKQDETTDDRFISVPVSTPTDLHRRDQLDLHSPSSRGGTPPPSPPQRAGPSRQCISEWQRQREFLERPKVTRSGRIVQLSS
jgi:hypothetical protein